MQQVDGPLVDGQGPPCCFLTGIVTVPVSFVAQIAEYDAKPFLRNAADETLHMCLRRGIPLLA